MELSAKKYGMVLPMAQWQIDEIRKDREAYTQARARMDAMTPAEYAERSRAQAERRTRELADAKALHATTLDACDAIPEWHDLRCRGGLVPLRRIVERHHPINSIWVACAHCEDGDDHAEWPCPDFRDAAAAVGIEVPS